MQIGVALIADTTILETYMKSIPKRLQAACTDQVKRSAEDARLRAPKDTTAMSESVYWIDATGKNNYNERSKEAERLNPRITDRWGSPLPSVEQPPYPGATLAVAAPYAAIVNGGFAHDRHGNQIQGDPFFTETIEVMREEFPNTVAEFLTGHFMPDLNNMGEDFPGESLGTSRRPDELGGGQSGHQLIPGQR